MFSIDDDNNIYLTEKNSEAGAQVFENFHLTRTLSTLYDLLPLPVRFDDGSSLIVCSQASLPLQVFRVSTLRGAMATETRLELHTLVHLVNKNTDRYFTPLSISANKAGDRLLVGGDEHLMTYDFGKERYESYLHKKHLFLPKKKYHVSECLLDEEKDMIFVSCFDKNEVLCIDTRTNKLAKKIEGHLGVVNCLRTFAAHPSFLATAARKDAFMYLWVSAGLSGSEKGVRLRRVLLSVR